MEKNKTKIKNDFLDIKFRSYKCKDNAQSLFITKYFKQYTNIDANNSLNTKIIPFLYNECLDFETTDNDLKNYFNTIKNDVKTAFNIPEILQTLEDYIDVYDMPKNENDKKLLFRYKKMKQLERFYDILVKFTLSTLHNFFWTDICKGVDKGVGTKNLSYHIERVLPIMLKVKQMFENLIQDEYKFDKYDKSLFEVNVK